jgi:acylphosphatase
MNKYVKMSYSPPETEKSRLKVICSGKSIESALFRAEVKKELTFFRGCSGIYNFDKESGNVEIIGEGKTQQLARFMDWLTSLTTEMINRKVNFQGPPLIIKIESYKWEPYQGINRGFIALNDIPSLESATVSNNGSTMEAKNMAGTDESV